MSNVREPEIVTTENKKSPLEVEYINAADKNVATRVIYTADKSSYTYDEDGEIEVKAEDMFNLFVKGVIACYNGAYYAATSCTKAGVIAFAFPA